MLTALSGRPVSGGHDAVGWGVALGFLTASAPAAAIPSPELVVGSLSSLSQLVAVVSALLGGGALAAGAGYTRRRAGHGQHRAAGPSRWVIPALALTAVASVGFGIHQHLVRADEARQRLEQTLVRPAAKDADGKLLDSGLKEMSFAEQRTHPRGMDTAEAARLIEDSASGRRSDVILLDIRETAETEMGSLPGAVAIRFPDLDRSRIDLSGRKALLFCHNGNRSAETCARMAERGLDCAFIVGGLETWLTQGRPLAGSSARSLEELRALPSYPNQRVLLDTGAVRRLLTERAALLVDVRYPGEFAAGHLPGAINLPIRPTPTEELARRLASLPAGPVIAPCYDRRSCFFAELLGLELTRRGREFLGRYTLPWEYFEPARRPPHVETAMARASQGLWQRAARQLADLLVELAAVTGLPAALVLLAMLSRVLVLPFSIKAERDQQISVAISAEVAALKRRLAADPVRLSRALQALYRRHGLTPARNLLALAFLPVLALSVEAASLAAEGERHGLWWIGDLSARDASLALPIAFAVLIGVYVHWTLVRTLRHKVITWAVAVPLLVVSAALLSAAADVYMVASAVLLLGQRWLVASRAAPQARRQDGPRQGWSVSRRRKLEQDGVVSLDHPERLKWAGNKAHRLARLRALDMPVPDGLVLTSEFLERYRSADPPGRRRMLDRIWRALGARTIAVRSSAAGEDGAAASFAGVFDTVLDVSRPDFDRSLEAVLASFGSRRAASYAGQVGAANVLLQPMVAAAWSGVLFTEDPASPALMLVELVEGTAEKLVSGRAQPAAYRIGRATGRLIAGSGPPIDLAPLVALAKRAETALGAPQDIEWAYADGRFVLLQSRDITAATGGGSSVREEWRRLARIAGRARDGDVALARNEMAEMLPCPTPLTLSLIEALWAPGGSVDLAARALGCTYHVEEDGPPYHVTVFGRLYIDKREERARAIALSRAGARRLARRASEIERDVRRRFMPALVAEVRLHEAIDFDRLATAEMLATLRRMLQRFVAETHVEVEVVNIAARFYLDEARAALDAAGEDAAQALASIAPTILDEQLRLAQIAPADARRALLIEALGHRAALDYELAAPRYGESGAALDAAAEAALSALWTGARTRGDVQGAPLPSACRGAVRRARRFQTLKEDAKHHALRELALLRRLLLALDRRLGLQGAVFHLTLEELTAFDGRNPAELARTAEQRRAQLAELAEGPLLDSALTIADIERASLGLEVVSADQSGVLKGTRVSGMGLAEGRAIVVPARLAEVGAPIDGFQDGDIIVSPMIHPAWLPFVLRAGGVVSEVGGWLSHMSIVAREHDIAMIVGVRGWSRITSGERLQLRPDGLIATARA